MKFNLRKPPFDPLMSVDRIIIYVYPHFFRLTACYTIIHSPESVDMKLDMNIKAMINQGKTK